MTPVIGGLSLTFCLIMICTSPLSTKYIQSALSPWNTIYSGDDTVTVDIYLLYSQTCSKDHLLIKTVLQVPRCILSVLYFPAYKDHLCIRTTFCWSLGWSLYASLAVHYTVVPLLKDMMYTRVHMMYIYIISNNAYP